jgi:hypothetical protein
MPKSSVVRICCIANCGEPVKTRSTMCYAHRYRKEKYGDPLAPTKKAPRGAIMKFIHEVVLPSATDECILWRFSKANYGYGELVIAGRKKLAHRVVCELAHGLAPQGKNDVAHSCNNRLCVNPAHLRWASRAENVADMVGHGTAQRGERSPLSKLTEDQVREIRQLEGKMGRTEIGRKFGICHSTVYAIIERKSWFWLD